MSIGVNLLRFCAAYQIGGSADSSSTAIAEFVVHAVDHLLDPFWNHLRIRRPSSWEDERDATGLECPCSSPGLAQGGHSPADDLKCQLGKT